MPRDRWERVMRTEGRSRRQPMSCTCPETNWMDGKGHSAGCPLRPPTGEAVTAAQELEDSIPEILNWEDQEAAEKFVATIRTVLSQLREAREESNVNEGLLVFANDFRVKLELALKQAKQERDAARGALRQIIPSFNMARLIMDKEARDLAGEIIEQAQAALAGRGEGQNNA